MVAQRESSSSTGQSSQMTTAPAARRRSAVAGLRVGAAAERQDERFARFGRLAQDGFELLHFDAAKAGLAHLFKDGGNGEAGGLFDARVQVFKAPA